MWGAGADVGGAAPPDPPVRAETDYLFVRQVPASILPADGYAQAFPYGRAAIPLPRVTCWSPLFSCRERLRVACARRRRARPRRTEK